MEKVRLEVLGIGQSQFIETSFAMILVESDGNRRLPIMIGNNEAQAIAIELEKMKPQRPLTHDLFKSLMEACDIILSEVIIYKVYEGVFYSKLILDYNGKILELDSRTSDAVSIAIRVDCPIYTYEHILESVGMTQEDFNDLSGENEQEQNVEKIEKSSRYSAYSLEELNAALNDAVGSEDYEKASMIRDEIKKRGE